MTFLEVLYWYCSNEDTLCHLTNQSAPWLLAIGASDQIQVILQI